MLLVELVTARMIPHGSEALQTCSSDEEAARAAGELKELGGVLIIMNSLSQGGGDRVAVLLANGFAEAGIPTRIVLMRDRSEPQVRALLHRDVSVLSAGRPMGLKLRKTGEPLGHRHLERLRGISFVRSQIDDLQPAVVLGATDNMALTTALVRRPQDQQILFGFKLTNRLSRPDIGPARRFYRSHLFRFIFDRMDLVLTLSEGERRHVLSVHPGREQLLKTVANPYVTSPMLANSGEPQPGPPRLLAAGRMVPQKRFDALLRAFALSKRSEAKLTILGDGPLRRDLQELAETLGVAERIEMPGYVGDIIPALRQSHLFVLSSDYEGLPAVIIEALACNVAVATTESFFAARDLLGSQQSCAVVPIGDPAALAAAIDRCLEESDHADLRTLAEPYRVDSAVNAHIIELASAVRRQKRTETPE